MRLGVFPGSFNPPTRAHLAISQAAVAQRSLTRLVWAVSQVALAKEDVDRPRLADRLTVLRTVAAEHNWLEVEVTDAQLLAEIAIGYDVIVMGADKWQQIHDPVFYDDDPAKRDAAIASLPTVALAPRPPHPTQPDMALDLPAWVGEASSTLARTSQPDLMLGAAARFDAETGAWTDAARYDAWLRSLAD